MTRSQKYEARRKLRRATDPVYRDRLRTQARARYERKKSDPDFKLKVNTRSSERSRSRWSTDPDYKEKRMASHEQWYSKQTPDYHLARRLRRYGLTIETYTKVFDHQFGKCAICPYFFTSLYGRDVQTDHDHGAGELRGLLCSDCNTSLGKFGDNMDGILKVVAYLQEPPARRLT